MSGQSDSSMDVPTQPGNRSKGEKSAGKLVVLRGAQAGKEFILQPGINLFGREEGNILRDVRVSRRHAYIQVLQGEFTLFDSQSTNGTFVNGQRITKPVSLQHGDTIRMGDTIMILKLEGQGLQDPSILGARTPDLTSQNPSGTTVLARRDLLSSPTRTDAPFFSPKKETDLIKDPESGHASDSSPDPSDLESH